MEKEGVNKHAYRQCVAIVVYDAAHNLCLVGKRSKTENGWQFPQGSVDYGETHAQAARRELFEEMGVRGCIVEPKRENVSVTTCCVADIESACHEYACKKDNAAESYFPKVQFVKQVGPFCYDYPQHVKRKEKGQEQTWFLAHKNSNFHVILNDEFCDHSWMTPQTVLQHIVDFKKEVYRNALTALGLV